MKVKIPMNNKILHRQQDSRGAFYLEEQGAVKAEMTYSMAGPGRMIIDHTEVDPSLKGGGIGNILLENAVSFARKNNLKILPLCPFAAAQFKKHPDYNDVLDR